MVPAIAMWRTGLIPRLALRFAALTKAIWLSFVRWNILLVRLKAL